MDFKDSYNRGLIAENWAIEYFNKQHLTYQDVRDNKEYQKIDVDFLVETLGKVEVKLNLYDACKYYPGQFFWVETEIDNKNGWWNFTETDYFLFFNPETNNGILIQNNQQFKDFINNLIENGNRSINRFDYKPDRRYNKIVTAKNMRVYLEQFNDLKDTEVNITKIIKRKLIESKNL
jgi:hypothetical protein